MRSMNDKKCAFCSNSEVRDRLITENDLAWSFLTYQPITPGHTLVAPKRCVEYFEDLSKEEILAIFDLVEDIKKRLKKEFSSDGFNVAYNHGEVAGQTVPHVHVHVVPRKNGDDGIYTYEPREFLYRPGVRDISPQEELLEIAQKLKN